MPSLQTVFVFSLTFALPAFAVPTHLHVLPAPRASCYSENAEDPIPRFTHGVGSHDPDNIVDGPNGFHTVCDQKGIANSMAVIPAGYKATYDFEPSRLEDGGKEPSCRYVLFLI